MSTMIAEPAQLKRVAALTELAADTPELVLDLDTVRANIDRAAAQADAAGIALRPHTKTHKLPQIAQLQLDAGAVGVQVAKLGEAEVMAEAGIEDGHLDAPAAVAGRVPAVYAQPGQVPGSLQHANGDVGGGPLVWGRLFRCHVGRGQR